MTRTAGGSRWRRRAAPVDRCKIRRYACGAKSAGLLALLALPLTAHAAEWTRVATPDVHQHFYDRAKLGIDGEQITYWRRVVFKTPQPSKNGPARSAMYRERIDCAKHTHQTLGYLIYGAENTLMENVYTPEAPADAIVPETVGDKFETLMCVFVEQARSSRYAAELDGTPQSQEALKAEIERLETRLRALREQLGQVKQAAPETGNR